MKVEYYQLNDHTWVTLKNFNGISYYIKRRKVGGEDRFSVLINTIDGRRILKLGLHSLEQAKTEIEINITERSKKK